MNFVRWALAGAALASVLAVSTALSFALTTGDDPKSHPSAEEQRQGQAAINAITASAPASQQAAVADGAVTFEEINRAMSAFADCGEAAGFSPIIVPAKGLRVMHVNFQIPDSDGVPDDGTVRSAEAVLAACRSEHTDTVQPVWELQKPLPTDQDVAELYGWLEACMAGTHDAGDALATWGGFYANAPASSSLKDIARADLRLYMRCAAEAEALTGLKAPAPTSRPAGLPRP